MSGQCKTREMLDARVRAELKAFGDSVAILQKHSVAALSALDDPSGFKKAQELAKRTKLAYYVSRQKLDDHIAAHGCQ
jgi:hypothetical protein